MSILINTRKLIEHATHRGWDYFCIPSVLKAAGLREASATAPVTAEQIARIPETVSYAELRKYVTEEKWLLDVADAREGVNTIKAGGMLLLAMAREFFVPEIPQDHPGYMETLRLLRVLQAYLEGKTDAEAYMQAAYHYRCHFGTAFNVAGKDPDYEHLFEAMPCLSIDSVIACDGWLLSASWDGFGRFLVRRAPEFAALDDLRDAIDETVFVDSDTAHSHEAQEVAHGLLDDAMAGYQYDALAPYGDRLRALIDLMLGYAPADTATTVD